MKKRYLIIGLGSFGLIVAKTLSSLRADVLAIDNDEDAVSKASEFVSKAVICDATFINNLEDLNAGNYDHAILAMGKVLETTILTLMNLKELGIKKITVRVTEKEHILIMKKLGADDVILPEQDSAIGLANKIVSESFLNYYPAAQGYGIVHIKIRSDFTEIPLMQLNLRNSFGINIVGIIRNEEFFIPSGTDSLQSNDVVVVIGKPQSITKFEKHIND
jgi:trk system potassium uptake protein TrkA